MEIRKILRQYAFSLVVILCIAAMFYGTVNVREKTQYNMDMTLYSTVEIEKKQDKILIYYGDKLHYVRTDYLSRLREKISARLSKGFIFDFRQIFA